MRLVSILCFIPGALTLAPPAWAQQDLARTGEDQASAPAPSPALHENLITVLATGEPEPVFATGEQVSLFDRADIEAVQGADVTRLLERAPGVTLSRNGGPGSFTALRVRGAEAEQLLVLVDGVRLADPAAPAAGFDLGTLAMGNLAKVELQRGSNSTIWGSQALGGVLAVQTRTQEDPHASLEYGSRDTLYATGGVGLKSGPLEASASAGHLRSDGFSAAEVGLGPDGYRQTELTGRARVQLASRLSAFSHVRFADSRLELDGFPAPSFTLSDTAEFQETRQLSGALGLNYVSPGLTLRSIYSQADTERENFDPAFGPAPSYTTDGTSRRAELRGRSSLVENLALHFGAEREWLSFATLFDPRRETSLWGTWLQADYERDGVNLAVGLRRDEHRDFGSQWSLGADASVALSQNVRLTTSYGEGFKAPSLFQLLSDFGNPALQPETSRSFDAGIEAATDLFSVGIVGFRRATRDQIAFVSCFGVSGGICADRPFGTYDNIARTLAQGIEVEFTLRPADDLTLEAVYALIDAEDRDTQADLARRPRHAATISATWEPYQGFSLAADLRIVGSAFDDAANLVPLCSYEVLTLRGSWSPVANMRLFGRIENAGDEDYQTAAGYATQGRSVHVGASLAY